VRKGYDIADTGSLICPRDIVSKEVILARLAQGERSLQVVYFGNRRRHCRMFCSHKIKEVVTWLTEI